LNTISFGAIGKSSLRYVISYACKYFWIHWFSLMKGN